MNARTTNLTIRGMFCATCTSTIEDTVADLDGVTAIDVIKAIRIADATISKVRQNLFRAFTYTTTLIPIASIGSIGLLNPALAGIAMAASRISVVSNSLAFMKWDPHDDNVFLPFRPFVWVSDQLAGTSKVRCLDP